MPPLTPQQFDEYMTQFSLNYLYIGIAVMLATYVQVRFLSILETNVFQSKFHIRLIIITRIDQGHKSNYPLRSLLANNFFNVYTKIKRNSSVQFYV